MKIESLQNEHVKELAKLKEKKYRDQEGLFLVEGDHLVKEALKYASVKEVLSLEKKEIPVLNTLVTEAILKKISSQVSPPQEIAVVEKLKELPLKGDILFLDGIQDPGNLGTIIRSAVAFHLKNIVLSTTCVDVYNEKVIRSTEGMIFQVNIVRRETETFLKQIKSQGYRVYGSDVVKGTCLEHLDFQGDNCFIIGSEGMGMSLTARNNCDQNFYIPMSKSCESLNAGVASSILLYERSKHL